MSIDISNLSAEELDDLIERAAQRRLTLKPEVPMEQPTGQLQAEGDPRWFITALKEGTLLQFRHRGHGWVHFMLPPANRALLIGFLLQHALAPQLAGGAIATPAPATGGGSTLH
jgi:hypothetical protein